MCGIVGFIGKSGSEDTLRPVISKMAHTIEHRGPDHEGIFIDAHSQIVLGFRRLAILDLSPNGQQPMHSPCGRYTIIFNGEIYNFKNLKKEVLETNQFQYPFKSTSDTEVLLAAISVWGVEATLPKLNGMFAIALWDRELKTLTLSRDRFGEKPLYYGFVDGALVFGSELKTLRAFPGFKAEIDRNALTFYFRTSYIPAPYTIYQGIYKLPPATSITYFGKEKQLGAVTPYWSALSIAEEGLRNPYQGTEEDAVKELDALLKDAVLMRMESDVPLGAFLSGGIDSSMIVSLMQAQSKQPIKTFTMGFTENDYDESPFAKAVATHLKTDHTEMMVSPKEAMDVIPLLPHYYDEPYADSSQIPTYLVSKIAKTKVTVSLSGDGGDELFGGYNRHTWGKTTWNFIQNTPGPAKTLAHHALGSFTPQQWNSVFSKMRPILPSRLRVSQPGEKLQKLQRVLESQSPENLALSLVSHWNPPTDLVKNAREIVTAFQDPSQALNTKDFALRMMYLDLITYLPDDILAKVDRASMAVSLESRVPFLDPRVAAFAWRLPLNMKIQNGKTKYILRKLLYKYVPEKLIDRPKMGFSIPIDHWIRGPLKDWAESLLDEKRMSQEGYLNAALVQDYWKKHLKGERNFQHHLWDVLMFQAWLRHSIE